MGGSYCWVHAWNCHGNAEISWHFIQCVGSKDSCTHGPLSFRSSYPTKGAAVFSFRTAPTGCAVAICETRACRSGVLSCSCQLKPCCISFMSNHLAENQEEQKKPRILLVYPFASVLKELTVPNPQSLALGEGGAGPCPADYDQLRSPRVAEQGCSPTTAVWLGSIFRLCNESCICFWNCWVATHA